MTFFQTQLFSELSAGPNGGEISLPVRAYFEQRFRNKLYQFILDKFITAQNNDLTKAKLARRVGKTPDVVNRWLGAPGNLTADTACVLLLGISGEEIELGSSSPFHTTKANYSHFSELCSMTSPVERLTNQAKTELSKTEPLRVFGGNHNRISILETSI